MPCEAAIGGLPPLPARQSTYGPESTRKRAPKQVSFTHRTERWQEEGCSSAREGGDG